MAILKTCYCFSVTKAAIYDPVFQQRLLAQAFVVLLKKNNVNKIPNNI